MTQHNEMDKRLLEPEEIRKITHYNAGMGFGQQRYDTDVENRDVCYLEVAKAQLKKMVKRMEATYDSAPVGKKLVAMERFMLDIKRELLEDK